MRDSILIKNAKCYFLAFETQKTYSIKICICYKICNLAIVPSHFWERTIARLYNILLIYLFSLQLSVSLSLTSLSFLISLVLSSSPTSLSFPHSLSLSLISSLPPTTRSYVWDRLGGEENGVMAWDRCGGDRRGDQCGDRRVMCFLVVVVVGVLWFLW